VRGGLVGQLLYNLNMKNIGWKIFAGVAYVVMVVVNFLANWLPINGRNTGAVSAAYPNLFAPAGATFSIWGLIYSLLGGYVVYQFIKTDSQNEKLFQKINPLFVATSFANISWIFAWHYDYIGLSVLIMLALLFLLIKIADILREEQFSGVRKIFVLAPFSVYFGWITVATIANITVLLVSVGWGGFGIVDFVWTSIILLVGAFIGIAGIRKGRNIFYGLTFVWAYLGILLKHVSESGFDGQYPTIIATVLACLALFGFFLGKMVRAK
jgi:hypothetical protein